jgi:hypothetical protein
VSTVPASNIGGALYARHQLAHGNSDPRARLPTPSGAMAATATATTAAGGSSITLMPCERLCHAPLLSCGIHAAGHAAWSTAALWQANTAGWQAHSCPTTGCCCKQSAPTGASATGAASEAAASAAVSAAGFGSLILDARASVPAAAYSLASSCCCMHPSRWLAAGVPAAPAGAPAVFASCCLLDC